MRIDFRRSLPWVVASVWFVIGLIVLVVHYRRGIDWCVVDWQVVIGFATWVLADGVIFAVWQIFEAKKSTNAQIAAELFKQLSKDDIRGTLRKIYRHSPKYLESLLGVPTFRRYGAEKNREKDDLRTEEIENIRASFDFVGALTAKGILDEQIAIEAYAGPPVLRSWYCLWKYIRKARKQRGGHYAKHLEDFAWRTWQHYKKQNEDEHIRFYRGNPNKSFDLIEALNKIEKVNKEHQLLPNRRTKWWQYVLF